MNGHQQDPAVNGTTKHQPAILSQESPATSNPTSITIKSLHMKGMNPLHNSVSTFLNLPYARIPARWHQAVPVDPTKEVGTIDATRYGARCPQPLDVLHDATSHLYPRMATYDRQSEFECLNLNVYAPVDAVGKAGRGLPVLVWIHGGAFTYGDGGCEFGKSDMLLALRFAVSFVFPKIQTD